MSLTSFFIYLLVSYITFHQSTLDEPPFGGFKLGSPLNELRSDFYIITGEEELYQRNEFLKKSIKRNINIGIEEGVYRGSDLNKIHNKRASKTTFFYFKNSLYKVRWSFDKRDFDNPRQVGKKIDSFLTQKYGPNTEIGAFGMLVWKDDTYYLQSLGDTQEYQIEYRNEIIHQKVEALKWTNK